MAESKLIQCRHCGATLLSAREEEMLVCLQCRRYGLIHGRWPKAKEMSAPLPSVSVRITES